MKLFAVSVLGALALAAPAFGEPGYTALYPETVPGAGLAGVAGATHTIVRYANGHGTVGVVAFSLSKTHVTYGGFRSTHIQRALFGLNAVKVHGTGLFHGRVVSFTAIGVHNALPEVDVFRISWNHGAAYGGRVTSGSVFIR